MQIDNIASIITVLNLPLFGIAIRYLKDIEKRLTRLETIQEVQSRGIK